MYTLCAQGPVGLMQKKKKKRKKKRSFCQAAISNLLIYFSSFDLSCLILEKVNFIENVYIVLSCLNK